LNFFIIKKQEVPLRAKKKRYLLFFVFLVGVAVAVGCFGNHYLAKATKEATKRITITHRKKRCVQGKCV